MRKRPTEHVLAEVDEALALKPPTTSAALRYEIRDLTIRTLREADLADAPPPTRVIDLMANLEKSLAAAREAMNLPTRETT